MSKDINLFSTDSNQMSELARGSDNKAANNKSEKPL